jgi:predicted PurR-regulated permease PerM
MLLLLGTGALYFLWIVRAVLYPFVIAFGIAYVLNPVVCVITRRGTPRIPAILMVYVALGSIIGLLSIFIIGELHARYDNAGFPNIIRPVLDETIAEIEIGLQKFVRDIFQGMIVITTHVIGLMITPILAFYILNDWDAMGEKIKEFIPIAWRREFLQMVEEIDVVLSGVIRGQLTVGLVVMLLVSTGLHFMNVDFAILIGVFAGLLDVVPYFGAIVGALPAIVMAMLQSSGLAIKVALLFFVVHQLEGCILAPKILGDNVGLQPLTVVFVLLVGGELYGLLGLLLAVPVAAILKVVAKHAIGWLVQL